MHDVIILAGGSSVRAYNLRDLEKRGTLIAVNDSAVFSKPHIAFTMDRLWSEYRYAQLLTQGVPEIWLREGIAKNFVPIKTTKIFRHGAGYPRVMSDEVGILNGSNSGTCAVNLAYQMRPARLFLLGYDMKKAITGEPYWYPPYPWSPAGATKKGKYVDWASEFVDIAKQFVKAGISVYNVSHYTDLTAFPVIDFSTFERMTK